VTTYFCDGLKDVTIVNGVARLEFHRLEVVERGGNRELRPVSEFIVALPVQGFVAQGLITSAGSKKGDGGPAEPAKSPNFS